MKTSINMAEYKIFIIIPVYNKANFLVRCLTSVQNQTYHNIEVIIIDDGSTDNSRQVCINFIESDNRFKYIFQENAGVSVARNTGLSMVSSNSFFSYLDADDWIEPTYCETMLSAIILNNADMAFCKINYFDNGKIFPQQESGLNDIVVHRRVEHFLIGNKEYVLGSACRILYRFDKFSYIKFNERLHIYEDLTYLLSCLFKAERLCMVDNFLYNYDLPQVNYLNKYFRKDIIEICSRVGIELSGLLLKFGLSEFADAELFKEYCLAVDWICNSDTNKHNMFKELKHNKIINNFNIKNNFFAYKKLYSHNKLKIWLIKHKCFFIYDKLNILKHKIFK